MPTYFHEGFRGSESREAFLDGILADYRYFTEGDDRMRRALGDEKTAGQTPKFRQRSI